MRKKSETTAAAAAAATQLLNSPLSSADQLVSELVLSPEAIIRSLYPPRISLSLSLAAINEEIHVEHGDSFLTI